MDSVKDSLRKINRDRSFESTLSNSNTKDSTPRRTLTAITKEETKSEIPGQIKPISTFAKQVIIEAANFKNQSLSTVLWRLREYAQRSGKYSHLQIVYQLVTHPQVGALFKSFEENNIQSSLVCKVRLKSAVDSVKRLLTTSGGESTTSKWVASVTFCEEIANKHVQICDVSFEEVSRWMEKMSTLNGEVEKSYAKFVKQLTNLREEFRSVHRGKEVGSVPDVDRSIEELNRMLGNENAEESEKMFVRSSKWLLGQVNKAFNILDECSSKFSNDPMVNFSSSLNNNFIKGNKDCSQEMSIVKKIDVNYADAEVQTEFFPDYPASSVQSLTKSSLSPPPIAHSTPRSSFSEGSNPLKKLKDVSDDQRSGGEEFRYKISSVQDMIAETCERAADGEKFRKLLELLDDGTETVKSSIVDLIVDKCPHLFN